MTWPFVYWALMFFWLFFSLWGAYPFQQTRAGFLLVGGNLLMFILFVIIGLHLFGYPVH